MILNCNLTSVLFRLGLSWWFRWSGICLQCGRPKFDPWVGKIPQRRAWQPTPIFLPGEFHGHRSLASCSYVQDSINNFIFAFDSTLYNTLYKEVKFETRMMYYFTFKQTAELLLHILKTFLASYYILFIKWKKCDLPVFLLSLCITPLTVYLGSYKDKLLL